ncbi:MAG TPA: c-type cytochrome [Longimicrobiales bacterium]|nr:c-type cytochrome [Longimicrobiales bacterium]
MWATNLKILAIVLGTVGFYTLIANSIPQVESEVPEELVLGADVTPEQLVAAGEELYHGAGGCVACHGLGTRAPNLLADEGGTGLIGARCGARVPGMGCKEYLHQAMVEPAAHVVEGYQPIMPDMDRTMSAAQIWAMIAFLESQGGTVTVTAEDIATAEGAAGAGTGAQGTGTTPQRTASTDPGELIRELGCLACHRLGAEGGPIGPPFDGIGARIDRERIRRGILSPNADTAQGYEQVAGVMPATYGEQLNAAQLEAIVDYLAEIRE